MIKRRVWRVSVMVIAFNGSCPTLYMGTANEREVSITKTSKNLGLKWMNASK